MAGKWKLTDEIERTVLACLRQGASPDRAAEAAGVPADVFEAWLRRPGARYRKFAAAARAAAGRARALAEIEVYKSDPKTWLRNGPGRDRDGEPGWTTTAPPARHREAARPIDDPAWQELWAVILKALDDFPEARAALTEAVAGLSKPG